MRHHNNRCCCYRYRDHELRAPTNLHRGQGPSREDVQKEWRVQRRQHVLEVSAVAEEDVQMVPRQRQQPTQRVRGAARQAAVRVCV